MPTVTHNRSEYEHPILVFLLGTFFSISAIGFWIMLALMALGSIRGPGRLELKLEWHSFPPASSANQ